MRAPGAVLLVACYELGHQPWNLAAPLAFFQEAGFAPDAIDTSVEALSDAAIRRAQLVAVSVPMHTALRLGTRVAARVRRVNPAAHICLYGLYAWLNREHLLDGTADSVVAGEAEAPLVALAAALEVGQPLAEVPGVSTRSHDAAPHIAKLAFPVPQRSSLPPLTHYAHFQHAAGTVVAGYVEASRGCLHTCLHCPITPVYGGRFVVVPREVVLADVRAQVAAGAGHITFGDPDFLNGPGHALRIVRALHAEFPALTWDATIKIEHLLQHSAILPELANLGCAFVVSAVEAFSDRVLGQLAKGHTAADVAQAVALCRAAGIALRPSLVAFTPWTTLDDFLHGLAEIERLGLVGAVDPVQYAIRLLVAPGSALLAEPDTGRWLGALDAEAFTYRWNHPDPRMDALHAEVAALVEAAAARGDPIPTTFARVKALAHAAAGDPLTAFKVPLLPLPQEIVPGLTEAWFC